MEELLSQIQLLQVQRRGRRPDLHVMIDLTSIKKQGKCKHFRHWSHYFHQCYGLHLVVLYGVKVAKLQRNATRFLKSLTGKESS